ncbi:MAG TPA: SH3 domain-containing protein, partial [Alphaproteobacteria bacterium]|nr:SH3 domain-containing protein [Alphaproteobacteria bacterium]
MIRPAVFLASLLVNVAALAQGRGDALPIPRYVSLKSDEVNVRTGPGVQYPIEWVFTRRHLPVEVIEQYEYWRKIRDVEGTTGWVHNSMISGKRYALVTGDVRSLRKKPEPAAPDAAKLEPGVIGQILECEGAFCRIEAGGIKGWLA